MKILVAIKQVPARDSQLKIASSGKWIEDDDLAYEINEPDAYALEAGLQLKEKHGGEVGPHGGIPRDRPRRVVRPRRGSAHDSQGPAADREEAPRTVRKL